MRYKLALFIILLLALFLRVISLNKIPYGFHADEARAAWGAWTIYKTGQDDWGHKFSSYYDTFGDQRPNGLFYAMIPFLVVFGRSVAVSRLPVVFFGVLSIFGLYLLTHLITKSRKTALFSAAILTFSPWHIVMSRCGNDALIAGALIIFGLYFFISGLKENDNKKLLFSVGLALVSYYFYLTARILVPIYWFACWFWIKNNNRKGFILSAVLVLVTLLFTLQSESKGRFSQVSMFSSPGMREDLLKTSIEEGPNKVFTARFFHNKLVWYSQTYIKNYLDYFSGNFLVGTTQFPLRYTVPYTGLLTYADFLLFVIGIIYMLRTKKFNLIGILLLLSPLVAAITITDTPNDNRSLNMVFFIAMLEGLGLSILFDKLNKKRWITGIFLIVFLVLWVFFWHNYTIHTPKSEIAYHRDGGTMELAQKINEVRNQYPKIYLTDTPSDLTPWIGFFGDWDVKSFIDQSKYRRERNWSIDQLYFVRQRCPTQTVKDPEKGSLLVDAENCSDPKNGKGINYQLDFSITRPDGSWVYKGWKVD